MSEMIFLNSNVGSRVAVVACPVCGRISKQILAKQFEEINSPLDFSGEHKCPLCSSIYNNCILNDEFKAEYLKYQKNPDKYNRDIKEYFFKYGRRKEDNKNSTQGAEIPLPENDVSGSSSHKETPKIILNKQEELLLDKKIDAWKSELLDLGKRNKMLNYRSSKRSSLQITSPNYLELFNYLAIKEKELSFKRVGENDEDTKTPLIGSSIENPGVPVESFKQTDEAALYNERDKTLRNLRSQAKLALEEQGINILYLSVGFIEWNDKEDWYKAPLIMVPVTIKQAHAKAAYTLSRYDDEIEVNPTLDYLFNQQFGIDLPTFDLKDNNSLPDYLESISDTVREQGWKLNFDVSLGLLSFLKIGMYHDLENNRERIKQNAVIAAMVGRTIPNQAAKIDLDKIHPQDTFQVLNADSSQQEAIEFSKMGMSFVMQGPPGTGKSQTITNIISEALAQKKKVLFVSEKAAALNVVLKRLTEAKLADFCLALHSYRANKKIVLGQIADSLNAKSIPLKEQKIHNLSELYFDREYLNSYADALHKEILPLAESLYSVIGKIAQLIDATELNFNIDKVTEIHSQSFNKMLYHVRNFSEALKRYGAALNDNPWYGAIVTSSSQKFKEEFLTGSEKLKENGEKILHIINEKKDIFQAADEISLRDFEKLNDFQKFLKESPYYDTKYLNDELREKTLTEVRHFKEDFPSKQLPGSFELYKNGINKLKDSTELFNFSIEHMNELISSFLKLRQQLLQIADIGQLAIVKEADFESFEQISKSEKIVNDFFLRIFRDSSDSYKTYSDFIQDSETHFAEIFEKYKENFDKESINNIFNYQKARGKFRGLLKEPEKADDDAFLRSSLKALSEVNESAVYLENKSGLLNFVQEVSLLINKLSDYSKNISISQSTDNLLNYFNLLLNNSCCKWITGFLNGNKRVFAEEVLKHLKTYHEISSDVFNNFDRDILKTDFSDILGRFRASYGGILKFIKPAYYSDLKEVRRYFKGNQKDLDYGNICTLLQKVRDYQIENEWLLKFNSEKIAGLINFVKNCLSEISLKFNLLNSDFRGNLKVLSELAQEVLRDAKDNDLINFSSDAKNLFFITSEYLNKYSRNYDLLVSEFLPELFNSDVINYKSDFDNIYNTDFYSKFKIYQNLTAPLKQYYDYLCNFTDLSFNLTAEVLDVMQHLLETVTTLKSRFPEDILKIEVLSEISKSPDRRADFISLYRELAVYREAAENDYLYFIKLFINQKELSELSFAKLYKRYLSCANDFTALDRYLDFIETKNECNNVGLEEFTSEIVSLNNSVKNVYDAFQLRFYKLWSEQVISANQNLNSFRRHVFEEHINKFWDLDTEILTTTQARIRDLVIKTFPQIEELKSSYDQLSILRHELSKKTRIKPIRRLFSEIPDLLLTLKPCLMMSPLSVAYFLESKAYQFDIVIFDEASQIFPQDAIGAIFRGKQVIIAGDSKQLPPTDFFTSKTNNGSESDYDNEDTDDYSDLIYDSILEETADILPNKTLLWHYRSKHESLITFSNHEIYGSELVTFPSYIAKKPDFGVEFYYVPQGIYANRRNIEEAKKCVELIKEHIEKYPQRSLGIIAFSEAQQSAILDELQDFRENNPQYEEFFQEGKEDEFFVKNLENVQGDERDTIIFSICYGRTKAQKEENQPMSMNFGPLSKSGGERRLNVAITRAKLNIKLVSSITSFDIDLKRASSEGARLLKGYLDFAKNGEVARAVSSVSLKHDDFTDYLGDFLSAKGYEVVKNLGTSKFKIDLALKNPDDPDSYLIGIEVDGYNYNNARTARDRDHLRESVLKGMGWKLYRVWSYEWLRNPSLECDKLLNFIENVQAETHAMITAK